VTDVASRWRTKLGHAVLHTVPRPNQEAEADQFAAALLMPATDGHAVFDTDLDLAHLAALKPTWGMSMAALARRAWDLGRISDYRYRELNIELSAAGYRTNEPGAVPNESPTLVPDVIRGDLA
jgi:Zn-dependent peptidase ImmA (M78 family)